MKIIARENSRGIANGLASVHSEPSRLVPGSTAVGLILSALMPVYGPSRSYLDAYGSGIWVKHICLFAVSCLMPIN